MHGRRGRRFWADALGGKLTGLKSLYVARTGLTTLPVELAQLTSRWLLVLTENRLSALPAEFGQLTNLRALELWGSRLQPGAAEFSRLANWRRCPTQGLRATAPNSSTSRRSSGAASVGGRHLAHGTSPGSTTSSPVRKVANCSGLRRL